MLKVLPALAVIWEDTATIGNILGLCTADTLLPLWAVLRLAVTTVVLLQQILAALMYFLSILPVYAEYDVH